MCAATVQAMKPVLYSYFRSSSAWRVRIALTLKGIEYEYKAIHLVKDGGEQFSPDYVKLNQMKEVPTLIIDGHTLTQSLPIIEYLEETRPGYMVLPKNPLVRAKVREISHIISSSIQPIQNLRVLNKIGKDGSAEWGQYWIKNGFDALEIILKGSAGKYCVGDEITMADLCLVPQFFNAGRFKVEMEPYPTICRIVEELEKNESFKAAHPFNQPDCPEDLNL
eukprot:TRINITY_DN658_c0_g4_i2.p1 TRINITY_DN658_c0_g4~~TRINITY_DN658_c0_g4_i2.p1  ORF type:complete len:222 (-),score=38.91 TRINITY_DN658_c0_g4_i2:62-727(-)